MDVECLHKPVDAVSAVMRVVQAIDPISHAPIAQDVVESFIILLDQLGDDLVFFFRFWDISLQPLIIGCSPNTDLTTQPANAPALFCVALLDCFIGYGMAQPYERGLILFLVFPYPVTKTPLGYPIRSGDLSVRSFAGKIFAHSGKHPIC